MISTSSTPDVVGRPRVRRQPEAERATATPDDVGEVLLRAERNLGLAAVRAEDDGGVLGDLEPEPIADAVDDEQSQPLAVAGATVAASARGRGPFSAAKPTTTWPGRGGSVPRASAASSGLRTKSTAVGVGRGLLDLGVEPVGGAEVRHGSGHDHNVRRTAAARPARPRPSLDGAPTPPRLTAGWVGKRSVGGDRARGTATRRAHEGRGAVEEDAPGSSSSPLQPRHDDAPPGKIHSATAQHAAPHFAQAGWAGRAPEPALAVVPGR